MKTRLLVVAANIGFLFLVAVGFAVEAGEIKVLSALAMKPVMEDLGPKFERAPADGASGLSERLGLTAGPSGNPTASPLWH